jgi:serine/threonine-protein kinase
MALTQDADWWSRIDAVFQGALELPADDRADYLDRACGTDRDLRAEIVAMLSVEPSRYALRIERLVHDSGSAAVRDDPFVGIRLGAWRVMDVIGQGGMGTVYLAERADGQYEQRVALKLVRGPVHVSGASSRLTAESQILARLSHPSIARLLDAGLTPEGSAYLVMELVDGDPITTHCDSRRLTIDARLRLFKVVCDATQHAHQSLVVHRDLKPSNIFVSRTGQVKLLDFGIAKLLQPDRPLAEDTTHGMRALTPAYSAPEQLRGEPVTTATDVYVLGAVLCELLTGQRATSHDMDQRPAGESQDVPTAPSVMVRRRMNATDEGSRTALLEIAAARGTSPARLARSLAGDIDRVVLKALQPEPGRRYGSAGQMGDDLQRLLDGRPVMAQPDTLAYRTRRFVGRHRVGVAMATAVCALVLAFSVLAVRQARAVAMERDRARMEASRAERVSVLVTDLFKLAEPAAGRGDTITARELLDRGAHRIAMELQGDPGTQRALFTSIARVYGNLGLHDQAIEVLERALTLEQSAPQGGSLARADTLHLLAERHSFKNDYPRAERQFREALALRRQLNAPAADVAATLEGLGRTLSITDSFDEARVLMEESVAIRRTLPGTPGTDLMNGLRDLGLLLHRSGDLDRAQQLLREAVDIGRRIPGPSPAKVVSLLRFAELVGRVDHEPAKAEPLLREALAMARTIYAGDHREIAMCLSELASNLQRLHRLEDAEAAAREGTEMLRRLHGDKHGDTMIAQRILASVLRSRRKLDDARTLLAEALATSRAFFGEAHPTTLATSRALASLLEEQGRFREAFELRRDDLARAVKGLGEHDVFVAIGLAGLGQHGLISGRLDVAETSFTRALGVRQKIHPPGHWRIDEARGMRGLARLRAGRLADAETDLLSAHEGLRSHRGPAAEETTTVRTHLVELYERWNRPEQARTFRVAAR